MKSASDLQSDAIMIEGLLDGIDALFDSDTKCARNAMLPIMEAAKEKLNTLINDLDQVGRSQKHPSPQATPKLVEPVATKPDAEAVRSTKGPLFDLTKPEDHIGCLYRIEGLAAFGVCSTDNTWGRGLHDNYHLYEQIGLLAAQAIEAAEKAGRASKTAA